MASSLMHISILNQCKWIVTAILIALLGIKSGYTQSAQKLVEKGNIAYSKKDFLQARQYYEDAIRLDKDHRFPEGIFNLGNVYFKLKKFEDAVREYSAYNSIQKDLAKQALGYFNIGNCLLAQKKYDESIPAYKTALRLNPHDEDIRYNLTYATAMTHPAVQSSKTSVKNIMEQPSTEHVIPPISAEDLQKLSDLLNKDELLTREQLFKHTIPSGRKKIVKDW